MKGRGDRPVRVAERIREELSMLLQFKVKDPGVENVTITDVRVTPDLKLARVNYSVLGEESARRAAGNSLRRVSGFLRKELGRQLNLRYAPELSFHYDDSYNQTMRIDRLLHDIGQQARAGADEEADDTEKTDGE